MNDEALWQVLGEVRDQFDIWLRAQLFDNEFLIAGIGTVLLAQLARRELTAA